jgi:hypothetical protein
VSEGAVSVLNEEIKQEIAHVEWRFGRSKNPFLMDLGSGALERRRCRPGARGSATLLAVAAGRPCRLWRYLFDDAVGQLQQ